MVYLYVDYHNRVRKISKETAQKRLNRDAVICNIVNNNTVTIISDCSSYYANNPDLSPLCN